MPAKVPDPLKSFHPAVRDWFRATFERPTRAQREGWKAIQARESTLLLAPTGSGKTLAAFLASLDQLLFSEVPSPQKRCRVLYVSPLKALAVDIERNLRVPIAGIRTAAERLGVAFHRPEVGVRSGDTDARERARMARRPPDILITTPESLYLLLTSKAGRLLESVDTVILDEIHAVAGSKRGAHLALSLERLERLRRPDAAPLLRIGLSATQRPLDEIARLLGGGEPRADGEWTPRPVRVVDAGSRKPIDLRIEVPVEDMATLGEERELSSGPAAAPARRSSIWPHVHPRLLELVRAHRSTLLFVNSRRLAERLAAALNELAAEEIAMAHHGSIARHRREWIEDRLKRGDLPAIVATSSLELGIDMGAVDLVVQIEAPPSIASGLQRIGRANHAVGEVPSGRIFPKFRGDLLACAAAATSMKRGEVEPTRYPRNPLDVVAQQVVAIAAMETIDVDELFDLVRRAAPFAELPRASFDGVLDMLSGRYPSDEFRELRARLTWDRVAGKVEARRGAQSIAVSNPGTIPDRGLYGVFLRDDEGASSRRVGELDEEMVFETRVGDVFLLGASSWRVEEITHDRVLVSPAPGEPGTMPFWIGDRPSRPLEFGRSIGKLTRWLLDQPPDRALEALESEHGLDRWAAENLLAYLREQEEVTGDAHSDRTIVIERFIDEVGDWRVCVLSPLGSAVHAAWSHAVAARLEEDSSLRVECLCGEDGMMFRLPETGEPPDIAQLFPDAGEVEELVVRRLSSTPLFAARFRENAARALLLPRRRPGRRNPLWVQRKRSSDLLAVAFRYASFPIVLETYRQCLQDVFDLPGLRRTLQDIADRKIRVRTVETRSPSPFAASLLFAYEGNFIYERDAPLAERRARSLTIDHARLQELLGESELRQLLDPEVIDEVERSLQRRDADRKVVEADGVHDLLLALGALSEEEIGERHAHPDNVAAQLELLVAARRICEVRVAGERRHVAVEDIARYRDAIGVAVPRGLPHAHLEPVADPLADLVSRFARTHGPFHAETVAARLGTGVAPVARALEALGERGRVVRGAFLREGQGEEWCDTDVLRRIKRRSLAVLRAEVEPVEPEAYARLLLDWQGVRHPRRGVDGLLDVLEQLQGAPLVASELESSVLPARIKDYAPSMLDDLCVSGEIVWRGLDAVGPRDGRIALYLRESLQALAPPAELVEGELEARVREILRTRGATFFWTLTQETGAFKNDVLDALWRMVWAGEVTNDSLAPLRSFVRSRSPSRAARGRSLRSRGTASRRGPAGSEGRWSLLEPGTEAGSQDAAAIDTDRRTAVAIALLERHGVLTREAVPVERIEGGFGAVYPVLKALEERGRVRRGYFVAGLGATQFATGGADDRLRGLRQPEGKPLAVLLASTDPANPYGAALPWPQRSVGQRLERRAGSRVILVDGRLVAYWVRGEHDLLTFLPEAEPARGEAATGIVTALDGVLERGRQVVLLRRVDGVHPRLSPLEGWLRRSGFVSQHSGYLKRREWLGREPGIATSAKESKGEGDTREGDRRGDRGERTGGAGGVDVSSRPAEGG